MRGAGEVLAEFPEGGRVELVMRSGESVEGAFERVEGNDVVVSTPTGDRRLGVSDVEKVLVHACSEGPE